ncbi:MAG: hypothetical protein AAFQ73_16850 [Pseudomonadota bacterium]
MAEYALVFFGLADTALLAAVVYRQGIQAGDLNSLKEFRETVRRRLRL